MGDETVCTNLNGIAAHEVLGLACQQLSLAQITLETAAALARSSKGFTMSGYKLANEIQVLAARVEELGLAVMSTDNPEIAT